MCIVVIYNFDFYNLSMKSSAKPRKTKKPVISVVAVTKMPAPMAGSNLSHFRIRGTQEPIKPAKIIFTIIDMNKITPRNAFIFTKKATPAATIPAIMPKNRPFITSLKTAI